MFARVRAFHYLSNTEPPGVCGDSGVSTPRLWLAGEGGRRGRNKGSKASSPGARGELQSVVEKNSWNFIFKSQRNEEGLK